MISHKHKLIFIHIPKCGGSSINNFYFNGKGLDWKKPNYEVLYGWCPKRQIHLQHATSKQLVELNLITEEQWNTYFKFTFIRNPWDRSYSDYLWMMKDRKIKGSFKDYITKSNNFNKTLTNRSDKSFRGDHLYQQTDFFDMNGKYILDFIGRFENFNDELKKINKILRISKEFNQHEKRNINKLKHYSLFYTRKKKHLVEKYYDSDITHLNYNFDDLRKGLWSLKKLF